MSAARVVMAALLLVVLPLPAPPSPTAAAPERATTAESTKARARKPEPRARKAAPKAPRAEERAAVTPAPKSSTPILHEVVQGDTLGAIAGKYGVTVSSIVIANNLKGPRARLALRQRLVIPQRAGARAAVVRVRRGPVAEPLPVSLVLALPEFEDPPPFRWPVEGPVTSTFGRRGRSWHRGLDIHADPGTPIVAAAGGVVIASGFEPRYGQRVTIDHGAGFVTLYAHNERNLVDVGQEVAAGQTIALVGRTGRATGEHVHFEIRHDGRVYNPLYLLPLPPRGVQLDLAAIDLEASDDE